MKDEIAKELAKLVAGQFCSIVDIDQRDVGFAISGPMARELLSAGCPLDLSSDIFPSGSVARSIYGKAGITILNMGDGFVLECMRSFAPYLKMFMQTIVNGAP
jgi:sarcosine oxidase subunit gamma